MKKSKQKELVKTLACEILIEYMTIYSAVEAYYNIKLSRIYDEFNNIEDFAEYIRKLYLDIKEAK